MACHGRRQPTGCAANGLLICSSGSPDHGRQRMRINARREYPLQPSPSWLFHTWSTNVAASVALAKTGRRYTFYTCYSSLSIHHRRGAPHTATHQISSNIADSDDNLAQSFRNTSLSVVTGSALFATGSASAGKRQVESLENSGLRGEDSRKSTTRNEKSTTRNTKVGCTTVVVHPTLKPRSGYPAGWVRATITQRPGPGRGRSCR